MLTIFGQKNAARRGFCDGVSRRDFLTIGGMALGGISLEQTLRAESEANTGRSHKAIINIYLPGGPPHLGLCLSDRYQIPTGATMPTNA